MSDEERIRSLGESWAAAEVAADTAALDAMAHQDMRLVGPLGFVLDRDAWVHRYGGGELDTAELLWDQVEVRVFGDAAIAIGRQRQRASYRGTPNDGAFRITHVFVRDDRAPQGWLIAGVHLSPIAGPPVAG